MNNHENYIEVNAVEETTEVVTEGFWTKTKRGLKKHGPKLAVGAAALVCGLIGFALGKKSGEDTYEVDFEEFDTDEILDYSESTDSE